jgi:RHS repeat-associated protein
VYKPFGEVFSLGGSASLNLRFPGQYFLIELGLAYNWHRHYDADQPIFAAREMKALWNGGR